MLEFDQVFLAFIEISYFCRSTLRPTISFHFLKEQARVLDMIQKDPELANLKLIESPLVDVEIRGVPALKFMGDQVWR